jgi:transposase-like protein
MQLVRHGSLMDDGRDGLGRMDIRSSNMKKRNRRCDPQKQAYWEDVVQRWKESGQSVRGYCRAQGLRESAFFSWRRKLARRNQPTTAASQPTPQPPHVAPVEPSPKRRPFRHRRTPSFLPVRVVSPAVEGSRGGLEIAWSNGRVLRVSPGVDRQTLADVLALLEARPC